jgi:hypothetical protein
MSRMTKTVCVASLLLAGSLALTGCASAGSSATAGGTGPASGGSATGASAGVGATVGGGAGGASAGGAGAGGSASCDGGVSAATTGVVLITCDGTAKIHVQDGTVSRDFTGGQCHQAAGVWSASAGVVTEKGVYQGPQVDSVAVNNQSASDKGTIQASVGGTILFADAASLTLSDGGKTAHLSGKTTNESDLPGTQVTVDITC